MRNDDISATTQDKATGVEAKKSVGNFCIYYDPNGHQLVIVNEATHLNIIDEDNFLNGAIEKLHDSNKKLEEARQKCLICVSQAPSPEKVNPHEYDKLTAIFDKAQQEANKARAAMDEIHKELDRLDKPEPEALNKVSAIKELIPVVSALGKSYAETDKVRYVRPSKAFAQKTNHGQPKWVKVDIEEKEKNFFVGGKFDAKRFMEEVHGTFKKPDVETKIKKDFSEFLSKDLRMRSIFLTKFAENWSGAIKSCEGDPNKTKAQCDEKIFSFSAAAQFLRYTHGVGIEGDFDIKSYRASIKAEGRSELALLEGKSDFIWQIPDKRGWMLSLPARSGMNADLGLVRFVFHVAIKGFVGASLAGEASITVDAKGLIKGATGKNENPAPKPQGTYFERFAKAPESNSTAQAKAGAGAFAGAEATGEFDLAAEWKNPEQSSKYAPFAKYLISASIQAGIGIGGEFSVGYQEKVGFFIEAHGGLCFGAGAKGAMKLSIDATVIVEFVAWFAYQLRNVDFQYIEDLIDKENYDKFCMLQYVVIGLKGLRTSQEIFMLCSNIVDTYRQHDDLVRLMKRLEEKPELFKHATPEVKGNIIWMLTDTNYITRNFSAAVQNNSFFDAESWKYGGMKRLKKVVLNLLLYIQSKSEYRNVMQHMSQEMGATGKTEANKKKLLEFFGADEIDHWLFQWASSNYDGDFRSWLQKLPEEQRLKDKVSMNSFYDQLPPSAWRGVDIQETYLTNLAYAKGDCPNFRQPGYTAPEFANCNTTDNCDSKGPFLMLAQEGDAGQAPVLRTDGNDNVWQNKEAYLAMFERDREQNSELA